ncbi:hypothetical protein HPB51_025391 [Rhipicephalus microplus]|uniref:FAM192A/Fyv6 N-terminal domain-containing protein n=1 Tax=Rhipicephalus microplus TaxID=6941 RepID=A0A9J6DDM4_RHIMP|nr:hypothetical protein HPB51_025391 [Rhipicephalus microplus]
MSFGGSTSQETIPKFKSFVSESELEEKRRKRQEEWEKVRKADDPVEAPEEEYDPRSLFERLEEQRLKKQADYEEAHKLKNMIRGLDDDEVTFLEFVDMRKQEIESQRMKEDMQEIEEYRISFALITDYRVQRYLDLAHKAVATLSEEALEAKRQEIKKSTVLAAATGQGKKSQLSLLSAAVKRKCGDSSGAEKKQRTNSSVAPVPGPSPIVSLKNEASPEHNRLMHRQGAGQVPVVSGNRWVRYTPRLSCSSSGPWPTEHSRRTSVLLQAMFRWAELVAPLVAPGRSQCVVAKTGALYQELC